MFVGLFPRFQIAHRAVELQGKPFAKVLVAGCALRWDYSDLSKAFLCCFESQCVRHMLH
jgi:hypothetical protein